MGSRGRERSGKIIGGLVESVSGRIGTVVGGTVLHGKVPGVGVRFSNLRVEKSPGAPESLYHGSSVTSWSRVPAIPSRVTRNRCGVIGYGMRSKALPIHVAMFSLN